MSERTIQAVDQDGNLHEAKVSELLWRPSVYGVILDEKRENVLMVPQWDGYDFPGGGIDMGETIDQALIREVKEETGLDVVAGDYITVFDSFFTPRHKLEGEDFYQSILLYRWARVVGGQISTNGFDEHEKLYAKEAQWIPLSQLASLKLFISIETTKLVRIILEASSGN